MAASCDGDQDDDLQAPVRQPPDHAQPESRGGLEADQMWGEGHYGDNESFRHASTLRSCAGSAERDALPLVRRELTRFPPG
jgi:hypothetical protein